MFWQPVLVHPTRSRWSQPLAPDFPCFSPWQLGICRLEVNDLSSRFLNQGKEASTIENHWCTIERNWNPIDWDCFETRIHNGEGGWGDKLRSLTLNVYWKKMPKSRKEGEYDRKGLLHNWTQLKPNWSRPFSPRNSQWGAELRKPPPRIWRWGLAQLKIISAQLSTIEAQLIPGGSASKLAMGASLSQPPTISRDGSLHNWAQLKKPNFTFKFGMGGRDLRNTPYMNDDWTSFLMT